MKIFDMKSAFGKLPINEIFGIQIRKVDEELSRHNGFVSYYPNGLTEIEEVKLIPDGEKTLYAQPYWDKVECEMRSKDITVPMYKLLYINGKGNDAYTWTMQECREILQGMY